MMVLYVPLWSLIHTMLQQWTTEEFSTEKWHVHICILESSQEQKWVGGFEQWVWRQEKEKEAIVIYHEEMMRIQL